MRLAERQSSCEVLCAYGRVRWLPPITHADALLALLASEARQGDLHPATAVLGLWGASLLGLKLRCLAARRPGAKYHPAKTFRSIGSPGACGPSPRRGYDPRRSTCTPDLNVIVVAGLTLPAQESFR